MNSIKRNNSLDRKVITFAGGVSHLAMWHSAPFVLGEQNFSSVGQFLAWSKAIALGEFSVAEAIYEAETMEEARAYGKSLQGDDTLEWDVVKPTLAAQGAYAKFSQNPRLAKQLLGSGDALLVEVNPFDTYWASGMDAYDTRLVDKSPSQWPGVNVWGGVLQKTREALRQNMHPGAMEKPVVIAETCEDCL